MIEFPQSAARMVPGCQTTYELIGARTIAHHGSPVFADQVTAAAPRSTGEGWRLSKGKSKRKIDAAIALVMMTDVAARQPVEVVEPTFRMLEEFLGDDWDDD